MTDPRSPPCNSVHSPSAWPSRTSRPRKAFYEKFGFKVFGGDAAQNWLILKNGDHVIGLFQGMFDKNMLTFNPGWDQDAKPLDSFTDVRELQRQLKTQGVVLATEADEKPRRARRASW